MQECPLLEEPVLWTGGEGVGSGRTTFMGARNSQGGEVCMCLWGAWGRCLMLSVPWD